MPMMSLQISTFALTQRATEVLSPTEHIPVMNDMKNMIPAEEFSANVFIACKENSDWEADEVIRKELFRNFGVSTACISSPLYSC